MGGKVVISRLAKIRPRSTILDQHGYHNLFFTSPRNGPGLKQELFLPKWSFGLLRNNGLIQDNIVEYLGLI
jgi:hypothetical protein